ncbi:DNA-binding protein [Izhakiella australiensis]|uniref:DNA-binding protein n=1 Tax=Izhakiella australiensis TaxID=1926881 RepID=A0A1S8Y782_9GAMM|nr:DNA-binding protein [Izhakiella australiensis]
MERFSLSRQQAADFIGIDTDTLSQWCRSGRIVYTRKNPEKPKSPFLFTRQACIAALNNPLHTVAVSAGDAHEKEKTCHYSVEGMSGTAATQRRSAKGLKSLLGQRTESKLRSCTTGEKLSYGE